MKFEKGRIYLDHDGNKYDFIAQHKDRLIFFDCGNHCAEVRQLDGYVCLDKIQSKYDIISEYVEPEIEIEARQVWRDNESYFYTVLTINRDEKFAIVASAFSADLTKLNLSNFNDMKLYRNADGSLVEG